MQGARLVNTPAMNRIGRAVKGLDESCAEMCEKSTIARDAKEGCYFRAIPFAMIAAPGRDLISWSVAARTGRAPEGLYPLRLSKSVERHRYSDRMQPGRQRRFTAKATNLFKRTDEGRLGKILCKLVRQRPPARSVSISVTELRNPLAGSSIVDLLTTPALS